MKKHLDFLRRLFAHLFHLQPAVVGFVSRMPAVEHGARKLLSRLQPMPPQDGFLIGRGRSRNLTLQAPCVIRDIGISGSGRLMFLRELARQAIVHQFGLIFIDTQADTGIGSDLYDVAAAHGRAQSFFADIPAINANRNGNPSPTQVIANGQMLYWSRRFDRLGFEADRTELSALIGEITVAVTQRISGERPTKCLVVLDSSMAIFDGLHPDLEDLAALSKNANLSLLLSDARPHPDDALIAPHVTATLYQALDNPDELPAETLEALAKAGFGRTLLRGLRTGVAIMTPTSLTVNARTAASVLLAYTPIRESEKKRVS